VALRVALQSKRHRPVWRFDQSATPRSEQNRFPLLPPRARFEGDVSPSPPPPPLLLGVTSQNAVFLTANRTIALTLTLTLTLSLSMTCVQS